MSGHRSEKTAGIARFNRREALCQMAAAGLSLSLADRLQAFEPSQSAVSWPVTCRDVMLKRSGAPSCWEAMAAYGVDGVESDIDTDLVLPNLYQESGKSSLATAADRQKLQAVLEKTGKCIAALCMHNRFEERPDVELKWCREVAQAAAELKIPVIRIDVVPRAMSREKFLPFAADLLRKIIDATASTEVRFGIENHGNTTNDPEFLDALFEAVGSQRLGLTLDTGNFYWFGHPLSKLYAIYEHFAQRVFHTHCKSIAYPAEMREKNRAMGWEYQKYHCPIDQGDIDFAKVLAILKKAGYAGDLCIENEGLGSLAPSEAVETVKKEVTYLRNMQLTITHDGRFLPVARA